MDRVYALESSLPGDEEPLYFEIVGVIEPKDNSDSFWYQKFQNLTLPLRFYPERRA